MSSSLPRPPASGRAEEASAVVMVDGQAPLRHASWAAGWGEANHTASGSDEEADGSDGEEDEEGSDENVYSDDEDAYSDDSGSDDDGEEEGGGGGRDSRSAGKEAASAAEGGGAEAEENPRAVATCCICMDPWSSYGAHRVCCIPCGHVYGRSCLERWLRRCGNISAKCPQCGEKFKHKHIINLYLTVHLWNGCYHRESTDELLNKIGQLFEDQSRQFALRVEKQLKDRLAMLQECRERMPDNQTMSQRDIMNFMLQNWPEPSLQFPTVN